LQNRAVDTLSAEELGGKTKRSKRYTKEESDYIREHYYKTPVNKIAMRLGKSPMSIKCRASKMGITRHRGWNSRGDVKLTVDSGVYREPTEPLHLEEALDLIEKKYSFATREEIEEYEKLAEVRFRRATRSLNLDAQPAARSRE